MKIHASLLLTLIIIGISCARGTSQDEEEISLTEGELSSIIGIPNLSTSTTYWLYKSEIFNDSTLVVELWANPSNVSIASKSIKFYELKGKKIYILGTTGSLDSIQKQNLYNLRFKNIDGYYRKFLVHKEPNFRIESITDTFKTLNQEDSLQVDDKMF